MNRLFGHSITKTPTLTRGDEEPRAACSLDPFWFDQAAGDAKKGPARERAVRQAKAICAGCPLTGISGPCIKANREEPGVVAGMTQKERQNIGKRKPCGTDAAYDRHIRAKEKPCEPCREAHRIARQARQAKGAAA